MGQQHHRHPRGGTGTHRDGAVPVASGSRQLALDYEPGLVDQWPGDDGFADLVSAAVHGSRQHVDGLAIACDRSPSLVSRQLYSHREEDSGSRRHFPLVDFPKVLRVTGDMRPLLRLVAEFLDDSQPVDAIDQRIRDLSTELQSLIEQRGQAVRRGGR